MTRKEQLLESQALREARATENMKQQELLLKNFIRSKVIADQCIEYHNEASFSENYEVMMHRGRAYLCSIDILEDPNLSSNAKVAFQIISSLCFHTGYFFGSNLFLAKKMGKSEDVVKAYLNELETYGLIKRDTYKTRLGFRRSIYIQFQFIKDLYFTKPLEVKRKERSMKKKTSNEDLDNAEQE